MLPASNLFRVVGPEPNASPLLFGQSTRGIFMVDSKSIVPPSFGVRILDRTSKTPMDEFGVASDGDVIAVRRKDKLELYRVRDQQSLVDPVAGVSKFSFSPIGSRLAYRTMELYVLRLDDDRTHDVRLSGTDRSTDFAWSPVGNQLLW